MLIVLDFDGTLVEENSSRLFEKQLLERDQPSILKHLLLLVFFSRLSYFVDFVLTIISKITNGYDLRRRIIIKNVSRHIDVQKICECIELTAKSLSFNKSLSSLVSSYQNKLLILSSGLDVIIRKFLEIRGIRVKAVIASKLTIDQNSIKLLYEIRPKDKVKILCRLSHRFGKLIYITDDMREYYVLRAMLIRNSCEKVVLVLI